MSNTNWMPEEEFAAMRRRLVDIFWDTMRSFEADPALREKTSAMMRATAFRKGDFTAPERAELSDGSDVTVVEDTTYHCASRYTGQYHTAVLDFASSTSPGGGVLYGARAQEESLCRCSNLYYALDQDSVRDDYYVYNRAHGEERGSDRLLYVPGVTVVKNDEFYAKPLPEDERFETDVIVCAAPNLKLRYPISDEDLLALHIRRGRLILEAAIENHAEVLILGAFGCGAFRNPPRVVAEAYRVLLKDQGYARYFRKVIFAIKKDHNDWEDGNFRPFKEIIG